MGKVALLGNAGGGKSTLGGRLPAEKGIPLYSIDQLQWRPGSVAVPDAEFEKVHEESMRRE
jgi:adenylate kinase family enzyme